MSSRRPEGAKPALPLKTILPLLLLLLLLAACARKGPVRPLLKPLPAAPGNFTIVQKGDHFLLGWGIPQKNQNGTPLTDLQGFRLYRLRFEPGRECPECREANELWRQVDLDYLQVVRRLGERLYLRDGDLEPGFGYHYRVVPFTRSGFEGNPAIAQRIFMTPPPTPKGLSTTALDHLVRLAWEPVEDKRSGVKFLGYNVYRTPAGQPFSPSPVNPLVLREPRFEDFGVENGQTYRYAVRAVILSGGLTVESSLSNEVRATPEAGK
jgi:hypothetical protein